MNYNSYISYTYDKFRAGYVIHLNGIHCGVVETRKHSR